MRDSWHTIKKTLRDCLAAARQLTRLPSATKWNFFFAAVAIAGIAIAVIQTRRYREEDLKQEMLATGAQVYYEWDSNFTSLLFRNVDPREAAQQLTGEFSIRNQLSAPIQNVRVRLSVSFDELLVTYPYESNVKAYPLFHGGFPIIEPGGKESIPVALRLRQSRIDPEVLFRKDEETWNGIAERWNSSNWPSVPALEIDSARRISAPIWSNENFKSQAIFGRAIVEYEAAGRQYAHVLTMIIGRGLPVGKLPFTPVGSHFSKQGYSKITSPNERVDYLELPQVVVIRHMGLDEALPKSCGHSDFTATNTKGGNNTFTMIWCEKNSWERFKRCRQTSRDCLRPSAITD